MVVGIQLMDQVMLWSDQVMTLASNFRITLFTLNLSLINGVHKPREDILRDG